MLLFLSLTIFVYYIIIVISCILYYKIGKYKIRMGIFPMIPLGFICSDKYDGFNDYYFIKFMCLLVIFMVSLLPILNIIISGIIFHFSYENYINVMDELKQEIMDKLLG